MNIRRFADILSGVAVGALLVIACSDSSSPQADAATCNCPAAEPPLAGRIVEQASTAVLQPANPPAQDGRGDVGVLCPAGATVLSGGCHATGGPTILLERAFPTENGWLCAWKNTDTIPITTKAIVKCLMPAQ